MKIAVLALAYFVSAEIGLLLAVPPGYATPIFPAAGVALAGLLIFGYRLWPGIFIGSYLLELFLSFETGGVTEIARFLFPPVGVAVVATLQALFSAYLVRKFVVFPIAFKETKPVLSLLFFGGPIGCLVGAVLGVAVLVAFGRIPLENYLITSATRWTGDLFGVLVFTPLILVWAQNPGRSHFRANLAATVPAVAAFIIAVMVAWYAASWEKTRLQVSFDRQATFLSEALKKNLTIYLNALNSLKGFVVASDKIDDASFRSFARQLLDSQIHVQAFGWDPLVLPENRDAFETDGRRLGFPDFRITERTADNQIVPAGDRPYYVPVKYIEPVAGNRKAIGFDVASNPVRREALERARDSGRPVTTGRIRLVQETEGQFGVLTFQPVYKRGNWNQGIEDHRQALKGFVVGVLRLGDLVNEAFEKLDTADLAFQLVDLNARPDQRWLYANPLQRNGFAEIEERGLFGRSRPMSHSQRIDPGDRSWAFEISPTAKYIARHRPDNTWLVLIGGLAITSMVVAFSVVFEARNTELANLVDDLREAKTDADRANQSKSQFLSAMSHELRTPLNTVIGSSDMLRMAVFGPVENDKQREYLDDIHDSGTHLLELINDLLDIAAIEAGAVELAEEDVDLSAVVETSRRLINQRASDNGIDLLVSNESGPQVIYVDIRRFKQALLNVLSNAVKFTQEDGKITLETRSNHDGSFSVVVVDTGIGMDKDGITKAMAQFGQVDSGSDGKKQGTGLGLPLTKELVELHGGTFEIESALGYGTMVTLTFPAGRVVKNTDERDERTVQDLTDRPSQNRT